MKLFNAKLADMRENPWNSNRMDEEHFEGLVQSISDYPDLLKAERVVVRELDDDLLEILGGAHRFRAAKLLKFDEMPVGSLGIVSDDKAKLISLILNNRGTESYDRKMDVIYSIKAVYNVSDIARKIGMDAVRLNGVIDSMSVGVDAMANNRCRVF
jgi:ParB-like chromosome segregation protein Spo0J